MSRRGGYPSGPVPPSGVPPVPRAFREPRAKLFSQYDAGIEAAIRNLAGELRRVHDTAMGDPWKAVAMHVMARVTS